MSKPSPTYAVTVGIDWADLKHDVFERHPDGSLHHQQINSSPEAITNWLFELRSVSAEGRAAVAVEQRRGPLFHRLSQCLNWMDLYPINPQTLARYRQAFYTSRAKDDPVIANYSKNCYAPILNGFASTSRLQNWNENWSSSASNGAKLWG